MSGYRGGPLRNHGLTVLAIRVCLTARWASRVTGAVLADEALMEMRYPADDVQL
jgi:hypothetical protein